VTENSWQPPVISTLEAAFARTHYLMRSDPWLAAQQAREIIKAVPHHPRGLLLLGVALRLNGSLTAAIATLGSLIEAEPQSAAAHFELGVTLDAIGRPEAALESFHRAAGLRPDMPEVWRAIGDHWTALGETAAADAAYAHHLKASVKDERLMSAASALCANRIPEAERILREHLKTAPTDVAAIRMLAEVAGRLGRYNDAETLLVRCLELAPSFRGARHNYAIVLHKQNKPRAALLEIERMSVEDPREPGLRNLRAVVLARIGEYRESIQIYADLLAAHPGEAAIWMSYGHALASAGRDRDSAAAYRRCVELAPHCGEAYWSLANLKTFAFSDEETASMLSQLARSDLAEDDRYHFEFAAGKALEDAGCYSESFAHYAQGNRLRRKQLDYRSAETTAHVSRSKACLTAEFFDTRAGFGSPRSDPIFIVGLPRAGSTLVEQILASHSAVEGTMELPDIISIARRLGGKKPAEHSIYPEVLLDLAPEDCVRLGEEYLERTRIQRKTGKPLFIDKMPNNFLHIGLIRLALPNAKIIDVRRHPMACCFSGFKQHFARGQRYTYSLEEIGAYYRDYAALMSHFDAVLPGKIHRVIYENLVEDTEAEIRRLLEFCGLPFENQCLRFHENARAVRTASALQVRRPIFRAGLNQWRLFERWLEPLRQALGPVLDAYPQSSSIY
jgi:tetratricopeptide (TPR) repeat protein